MVIDDDPVQAAKECELLADARAGDPDAFCRLAAKHEARLFRQAMSLCGDASVAEDLAAETIIEAWKSLARYNGSCRFSTWLYAILLHRHQKHVRHAASRPIALSRLPFHDAERHESAHGERQSPEPTPAENAVAADRMAEVQRAIDALPENHREVIRLRFFEDASVSEIAAVLGCPEGTIKSRLHHALEKMRDMKLAMNLSRERRDI